MFLGLPHPKTPQSWHPVISTPSISPLHIYVHFVKAFNCLVVLAFNITMGHCCLCSYFYWSPSVSLSGLFTCVSFVNPLYISYSSKKIVNSKNKQIILTLFSDVIIAQLMHIGIGYKRKACKSLGAVVWVFGTE